MPRIHPNDLYFGSYVRFDTTDSKSGAVIDGPDNAVGDIGEVVLKLDADMNNVAWLQNRFGQIIGYLDRNTSHKVEVFSAKGWTIKYVLSFCACTMEGVNMDYWGQVALIAYAPRYASEFERFLDAFAQRAGEGFRPDPQLSQETITQILTDPQSWTPSGKVKIPRGGKGTAILKDHRTNHDKLLDQARKGNKGCYFIGYAFIGVLIALALLGLHALGLF
ncbi:MAG: hypothetical protein PUD02_08790 [Eggerthellales bacterium]|nr:hypothetical protein [Eggerthellales bacterium]